MGLTLGAALVYLGGEYAHRVPGLTGPEGAAARFHLGVYILLGLPFFYLLTFCAEAEESEVEIMALCAALGVALYLMNLSSALMNFGPAVNFLLPITIYFVYATKVLPGLRVFKHVLRGYSYQNLGRLGLALHFFRRATQLDPKSPFAVQGLRGLHENLTLAKLDREPELVEILDFGLCLDRAERFLLGARAPTAAERTEADRWIARVLATDFTNDPGFNTGKPFWADGDGKNLADDARRGLVEADGSIVSAGYANFTTAGGVSVVLLRLKPDGSIPEYLDDTSRMMGRGGNTVLVGGSAAATLRLRPGATTRLRIVNAAKTAIQLRIDTTARMGDVEQWIAAHPRR